MAVSVLWLQGTSAQSVRTASNASVEGAGADG